MGNIELLEKVLWNNKDIAKYVGCSMTTASKIHQEALKHKGVSRLCPQKVKRDAVLMVLGVNFADEVEKLKMLEVGK